MTRAERSPACFACVEKQIRTVDVCCKPKVRSREMARAAVAELCFAELGRSPAVPAAGGACLGRSGGFGNEISQEQGPSSGWNRHLAARYCETMVAATATRLLFGAVSWPTGSAAALYWNGRE
jgi:hypothetical protein